MLTTKHGIKIVLLLSIFTLILFSPSFCAERLFKINNFRILEVPGMDLSDVYHMEFVVGSGTHPTEFVFNKGWEIYSAKENVGANLLLKVTKDYPISPRNITVISDQNHYDSKVLEEYDGQDIWNKLSFYKYPGHVILSRKINKLFFIMGQDNIICEYDLIDKTLGLFVAKEYGDHVQDIHIDLESNFLVYTELSFIRLDKDGYKLFGPPILPYDDLGTIHRWFQGFTTNSDILTFYFSTNKMREPNGNLLGIYGFNKNKRNTFHSIPNISPSAACSIPQTSCCIISHMYPAKGKDIISQCDIEIYDIASRTEINAIVETSSLEALKLVWGEAFIVSPTISPDGKTILYRLIINEGPKSETYQFLLADITLVKSHIEAIEMTDSDRQKQYNSTDNNEIDILNTSEDKNDTNN